MSYVREYHHLFKLQARDSDTNEALTSVYFLPVVESRQTMANHQLVFRRRETGIDIYYQTNPNAADPLLAPITEKIRLSFILKLADGDFFKRYLPDLTAATGPQLYFDNLDDSGAVQPVAGTQLTEDTVVTEADAARVYAPVFYVSVSLADAPTKLIVKNRFDNSTVAEFAIEGGGAESVITKVDLSAQPGGAYILTTDAAGAAQKNIYIDNQVLYANPDGLVNIYLDNAQTDMPNGGASFFIDFKRRE